MVIVILFGYARGGRRGEKAVPRGAGPHGAIGKTS